MTRRKLIGAVLVGVIRVTVATGAMAQDAAARPTVAIADVSVSPGGWTLPPPQLSATIIEMMMGELVASQRFHVYDGQWLVPEAEAGRVNLERLRAAATERRVDYVVLGSVTAFSTENKKKRFGGLVPTPFLLGGVSKQQAQLRVELTFRIVDVQTGEIVATANGEGMGIRRAVGVAAGGIVGRTVPLPVGAFAAAKLPSARDAMLDEAVRMAVHNVALQLAQRSLPGQDRPATARQPQYPLVDAEVTCAYPLCRP
jgi:curli biogenesis system outer membrane secretion channel CsgG